MERHEIRVVEEKAELDTKLDMLQDFLTTATFEGLDDEQKDLLTQQAEAMTTYSSILFKRISTFK